LHIGVEAVGPNTTYHLQPAVMLAYQINFANNR